MKRSFDHNDDDSVIASLNRDLVKKLLLVMSPKERKAFALVCKYYYGLYALMEYPFLKDANETFGNYANDLLAYDYPSLSPLFLLKGNPSKEINPKELQFCFYELGQQKKQAADEVASVLACHQWSLEKIESILGQKEDSPIYEHIQEKILLHFTYLIVAQINRLKIETPFDSLQYLNTCRWVIFNIARTVAKNAACYVAPEFQQCDPDESEEDDDRYESAASVIENCFEANGLWAAASNYLDTYFNELSFFDITPQIPIAGEIAKEIEKVSFIQVKSSIETALKLHNKTVDNTTLGKASLRLSNIILLSYLSSEIIKILEKHYNAVKKSIVTARPEWFTKENVVGHWQGFNNHVRENKIAFDPNNPYFRFFENIFVILFNHIEGSETIIEVNSLK